MEPNKCLCGCGQEVRGLFVRGHHWKVLRERDGVPQSKVCERCGTTYTRAETAPRQSNLHWLERRFCRDECRRADRAERSRAQRGELHPGWKGDAVSAEGGRQRARRLYPQEPCQVCGAEPADIHHGDGNPRNNDPSNILHLCRKHHIRAEDRMAYRRGQPGLYPMPPRTPELSRRIVELRRAGMTQAAIAAEVGRSQPTVAYHLRRWGTV